MIWTVDRLQIRQWPNEYFFQLCMRNLETALCLFIECPVVHSLWERVAIWVRMLNLRPVNWGQRTTLQEWFINMMSILPSATKQGLRSLIMFVIW